MRIQRDASRSAARAVWGRVGDEDRRADARSVPWPAARSASTGRRRAAAVGRRACCPPVLPPVFYAVGLNYPRHIEHARERGTATAVLPTPGGRLPGQQRADRPRHADRQAGRGARAGSRPSRELVAVIGRTLRHAAHAGGPDVGLRLDDRQRRQRPHLAARGPHVLAEQEQRHVQADGALDRDRRRPAAFQYDHARRRRRGPSPSSPPVAWSSTRTTTSSRSPSYITLRPATCCGWGPTR